MTPKVICFCGEESHMVKGALYCQNPECDHYLNPVDGFGLDKASAPEEEEECTDASIPFHDYNCSSCAEKEI